MLGAPSAGIVLSSVIVPRLNTVVGWQGAFQYVGVATIIVGILIFVLVRSSEQVKGAGSMFGGFRVIFGSRDLILTALAGFCLMWVELGTATWAIAHVKKLGISLGAAGSVMMFYGIGGLISPPVSGYLSDKIGNRKWILILSFLIIAPVTVVFGNQTDLDHAVCRRLFVWILFLLCQPASDHIDFRIRRQRVGGNCQRGLKRCVPDGVHDRAGDNGLVH